MGAPSEDRDTQIVLDQLCLDDAVQYSGTLHDVILHAMYDSSDQLSGLHSA